MKATPTTIAAVKHGRGFIYGRLGLINSSKKRTLIYLIVQMTNSQIERLEYGQISELGKKYKQNLFASGTNKLVLNSIETHQMM